MANLIRDTQDLSCIAYDICKVFQMLPDEEIKITYWSTIGEILSCKTLILPEKVYGLQSTLLNLVVYIFCGVGTWGLGHMWKVAIRQADDVLGRKPFHHHLSAQINNWECLKHDRSEFFETIMLTHFSMDSRFTFCNSHI